MHNLIRKECGITLAIRTRKIEAHHVAQELRIGDEPVDGIVRRGGVRRGALVPVGPVHRAIVVHGATIPHANAPAEVNKRCGDPDPCPPDPPPPTRAPALTRIGPPPRLPHAQWGTAVTVTSPPRKVSAVATPPPVSGRS